MLTRDENKRRKNLSRHGIDFADVESIFDFPMYSEEDRSVNHDELRLRSLGLLHGRVISLIWAPIGDGGRIISCRYGNSHETRKYLEELFHSGAN
ncbi:BrnT family toxin [Rugamonas sp. FT107W]|uniref:BrnT family toxin n=1 Tax=Duganella vulcania TaxID=2692166 RepID=A0A845HIP7_9BURK|nr:BrnT family toxin [Duganella vulcania]